MAKNGSYSYNDLGHQDPETGQVFDANGKEVPVGPDETYKRLLREEAEGPKFRRMPSERDAFLAAGGSLKEEFVTADVTVPSGGRKDIEEQAGEAKTSKSGK